jgi:hypothetical protein
MVDPINKYFLFPILHLRLSDIIEKWVLSISTDAYVIKNVQYGTYISTVLPEDASLGTTVQTYGSSQPTYWLISGYNEGYVYVWLVWCDWTPTHICT